MRNKCKRIISLVLVITILMISIFSVSAISESPRSKIISALQNAVCMKEDIGLAGVAFNTLYIAEPMYTYEYTSRGWIQNNVIYPLLSNGILTAWAISLDKNGDDEYQITTELVEKVKTALAEKTRFTLLYDDTSCYLYDGSTVRFLKKSSMQIKSRMTWTQEIDTLPNDVQLTDISESEPLGYTAKMSAYAQTYYECSVDFVSQNPPSQMCWAASIACIVNYKKGKSYTAVDVAKKHFGSTNFNQGLPLGDEQGILRSDYLLWYTYKNQVPGDGVISHNIQKDFPIMATFQHANGYHYVVICGINVISGYIKVMDPEIGFCSATVSSSGYRYYRADAGVTLTLNRATCRYWSV